MSDFEVQREPSGDFRIRRPVIHGHCGTVVLWYLAPGNDYRHLWSAWFERPDGHRPEPGTLWKERCSTCNRVVTPAELRLEGVDTDGEEL